VIKSALSSPTNEGPPLGGRLSFLRLLFSPTRAVLGPLVSERWQWPVRDSVLICRHPRPRIFFFARPLELPSSSGPFITPPYPECQKDRWQVDIPGDPFLAARPPPPQYTSFFPSSLACAVRACEMVIPVPLTSSPFGTRHDFLSNRH